MENGEYKEALKNYRALITGILEDSGITDLSKMDWESNLYTAGSRTCSEMVMDVLPSGARVLDLGCGMGFISVLLSVMGAQARGIDINIGQMQDNSDSPCDADWGSREAEMQHPSIIQDIWNALFEQYGIESATFDGEHIPFGDGTFNGVVAHAVLEHVNPSILDSLIRDINRVLADDGHLFVFRTPRAKAFQENLAKKLGLPTHDLLYEEKELIDIVERQGFQIVRSDVTDMIPAFSQIMQNAYNKLAPLLLPVDHALLKTSLRKYAHHMALVFQKTAGKRGAASWDVQNY